MRSKAPRQVAIGAAEATWLGLIVLLPLAFSAYSGSNFALPKAVWLRALAPVGLLALALTAGRSEPSTAASPDLRRCRVAFILLGFAVVVSLAMAANPNASFWGEEIRGGGGLTLLCQMALAVVVARRLRSEQQWFRLVGAAMLVGGLVGLFGLAQTAGLDPFSYSLRHESRASATLAHPSALGAYLLFPLFLGIHACLERWRVERSLRRLLVPAAVTAVVAMALFESRSRAALLAFVAGALIWWILSALDQKDERPPTVLRRPATPVVVTVLLVLTGLAVLVTAPLQGLRVGIDRPSSAMDASVMRRGLLWQTAAEALWRGPLGEEDPEVPADMRFGTTMRKLVGYGIGDAGVVLTAHHPPQRAAQLAQFADSTHNATFDVLLTVGFLGFGAVLWLATSLLLLVSRALGLVRSARESNLITGATSVGMVLGFVAPVGLALGYGVQGAGSFFLSGAGAAGGAVAGWVIAIALMNRGRGTAGALGSRARRRIRVVVAMLVTQAAFMQIGLAGIVAQTYSALLLGALVALAGAELRRDREPVVPTIGTALSVLAGLALVAGFVGAPDGSDPAALDTGDLVVPVMGMALAAGTAAILGGLISPRPGRDWRAARSVVAGLVGATVVVAAFALLLVRTHSLAFSSPAAAFESIVLQGRVAAALVGVVLLMLGRSCGASSAAPRTGGDLRPTAVVMAAVLVGWLIFSNPLAWWEADVAARRATAHVSRGEVAEGSRLHQRSIETWPRSAALAHRAARTHYGLAREAADSGAMLRHARRARDLLLDATLIAPWSAERQADLGRVYMYLASLDAPADATGHLAAAEHRFRIARYLQPGSAQISADLMEVRMRRLGVEPN